MREFEELIEHHARVCVAFEVDYDVDFSAGGCVGNICDTVDLLFIDEFGDALHKVAFYHTVRNLGNHDGVMVAVRFDFRLGAEDDSSATCLERVFYTLNT